MKKKALWRLLKALGFCVIGAVVSFAVLMSVARVTTAALNHNRSFFQHWASKALHQPVNIGRVTVGWHGFNPVLDFSDVTVVAPKHRRPLLEVKRLSISINLFYSLLKWELLPGHLTIVGTKFNVVEDASGQFSVKGIVRQRGVHAVSDMGRVKGIVLWMLTQSDVSIDQSNINLRRRDGQLIEIDNVRLKISNSVLKHTISGDANLVKATQARLHFVLNFHDVDLKLEQWGAKLYVAAKGIQLSDWVGNGWLKPYFHGLNPKGGRADIQVWSNWEKGQCKSIQSLLQLKRVAFFGRESKGKKVQKPLGRLNALSANILWERSSKGWLVHADHLKLRFNGKSWPEQAVEVDATRDAKGRQTMRLVLPFIRLQSFHAFIERSVYISDGFRKFYKPLKPIGELHHLVLQYTKAPHKPLDYKLSTQFNPLSFSASGDVPAVKGLSGSLYLTPEKGKIVLNGRDVSIHSPYLLSQSMTLDQFDITARWNKEASRWKIKVPAFSLQDSALMASGQGAVSLPLAGKPRLDLSAVFSVPALQKLKKYLPERKLAPHLLTWFEDAFSAGSVTDGKIEFHGALQDFPFKKGNGRISVSANPKDVTLNYAPEWPAITHLNARVNFHNESIAIASDHGEVLGTPLDQMKAHIADVEDPVLRIAGHAHGDLSQALHFLEDSPLLLGKRVQDLSADGPMALNLHLLVPLKPGVSDAKVQGDLLIKRGRLKHVAWNEPIKDVNGLFHFDNDSLTAKRVTASWYRQPLRFNVSTLKGHAQHPIVRFDAKGNFNLSVLDQFPVAMLDKVKGVMPYHAQFDLSTEGEKAGVQLNIASNLKGVSLDFPGPFLKKKNEEKTFHLKVNSDHYPIVIDYGDLTLDLTPKKTAWSVKFDGRAIRGTLLMPEKHNQAWYAHFDRIYWPKSEGQVSEDDDPSNLPPIDFYCADCHYGQQTLGKVTLITEPTTEGVLVKKLRVVSPSFSLSASASWWKANQTQWTRFNGDLKTNDMGQLLNRWGVTHALVGGKGKTTFNVRWKGAPTDFEVKRLKGDAAIHFENGRIVELSQDAESDLGLGRLLNLLSLQSLPDHLALNFDNQKEGFPFKVLEGDFQLKNGEVTTKDTSLMGDMAWVRVNGIVGFVKREYDLDLNIIPNVTSTFPLVATLLGGPVAGAITWVANKVLGREIGKAAQFNYRVTGTWQKPNVAELPKPSATQSAERLPAPEQVSGVQEAS